MPEVTVKGFPAGEHTFVKQRLEQHFMDILSAVKGIDSEMRYSHSRYGKPWIFARHHRKMGDINLDVTEKLVAMAVALSIMRIVPDANGMVTDVPCVVIDDERTRRIGMLEDKPLRRRGLIVW